MAKNVALETAQVTVLDWPEFQAMFAKAHRQGEHVAAVGPSGGGKSTVVVEMGKILGSRRAKNRRPASVVFLVTKPRDRTISAMIAKKDEDGFKVIKHWPPAYGEERAIVWPRGGGASTVSERQRAVFLPLMDIIYQEGGQTVVIDEAAEFERPMPNGLGMSPTMEKFWSNARSNDLTLIAGTQRPRNVTRLMWSEPQWIIILRPEDEDDLKRVAELSGQKKAVLEIVDGLGEFEFLCIRRQRAAKPGTGPSRALYVSKVDLSR